MPSKLEVVPAPAGKRLGAAVLDWLPPVTVLTILLAIGFAGITKTQSGGFIVYDTSSVVLFGGIGAGLTLVYLVVLATLEGRSGVTPATASWASAARMLTATPLAVARCSCAASSPAPGCSWP
ncbi:hypothetical protein PJ267_07595 [Arthrobacter sp. OVS8]|nr:hypothetical protein PJ267_07595 [Arthrobacter sp. OVS8]